MDFIVQGPGGIGERFAYIMKLAPPGWKEKHNQDNIPDTPLPDLNESSPDDKKRKSAWARLIKKVYGVDPLMCPKCGSGMKILAVIFDPDEIKQILTHLVKIGRAPPNFDPASLNQPLFFPNQIMPQGEVCSFLARHNYRCADGSLRREGLESEFFGVLWINWIRPANFLI